MPVTLLILIAGGAAFLGTLALRRAKASRFASRLDLGNDDFFVKYYAASGLPRDTVIRIRRLVADELEVPVGRLRPTDRFDQELRTAEGWEEWDDGIEALRQLLAPGNSGQWQAVDWGKIRTLDDLIRAACNQS
jgi:hypothetical protein